MARGLIKDYGMLMKAIGVDLASNSSQPINNTTVLYHLIIERYGNKAASKSAVAPVYEYRIDIAGTDINYLYLIDSRTDENGERYVAIRDGVYIYDDYCVTVINIDCTTIYKDSIDYKDVALFFENMRTAISSFFIDTMLRPTDSIFLSYFGAFCAIHAVFDVDKKAMIEMQQYMKPANKVIEEDNKIYENMFTLYEARKILYLHVCRAYEDGVNNVESNSIPVTKIVSSVPKEDN